MSANEDMEPHVGCWAASTRSRPYTEAPRRPVPTAPLPWIGSPPSPQVLSWGVASGERDSHLHTGVTEDHSATLPFQAQVRRPDPTIWWPEGQWNTMMVPTEVPLPRRTWRVPLGGGCTCVHTPREEKRRGGVRSPRWRKPHLPH